MADLQSLTVSDTGYLGLPQGTTAQRPSSPAVGYTRWNTDTLKFETFDGSEWVDALQEEGPTQANLTYLGLQDNLSDLTSYSGTFTSPTSLNSTTDTLLVIVHGEAYSTASISSLTINGSAVTADVKTSLSGQYSVVGIFRKTAVSGTSIPWAVTFGGQQYRMRISFWRVQPSKGSNYSLTLNNTGSNYATGGTNRSVTLTGLNNSCILWGISANNPGGISAVNYGPVTTQYNTSVENMSAYAGYTNNFSGGTAANFSDGSAFTIVAAGYSYI